MAALQIKKQNQTQVCFFFFLLKRYFDTEELSLKISIFLHACIHSHMHVCMWANIVQTNLPILCRLQKGFMVSSLGICDKSDPT